jgi:hypothetical protein
LPMGTTKPRMEDLTPMMDKVERCLSGCSTWLSYSRRLQMINSALTPIVTYSMCAIRLPRGVIENIDRVRKQCLWMRTMCGSRTGGWSLPCVMSDWQRCVDWFLAGIAGVGCGLTCVGAGEEQARKVVAGEASKCGEDK